MDDFVINRSKLVEIQITNITPGQSLAFPVNLDDLNNAEIHSIQVITSTQLLTAPSGRAVFAPADLNLVAVQLAIAAGSDKRIDNVPLYSTNRELNAGRYFLIRPLKWNPSASKIPILGAGLDITESICILFHYKPL